MAIRFDANNDYLNLASAPGVSAFTALGKIYLTNDRNAVGTFFLITDGVTNLIQIGVGSDGTTLATYCNATPNGGTNLATGAWRDVAIIKDGSNFTVALDGAQDFTFSNAITFTPASILFNRPTYWMDGRLANWMVYSAALTVAEIQMQRFRYLPQRLANLWAWYPMLAGATERLRDYSGNGRNLTANGTLADEDGPGVGWGASPLFLPYAAPAVAGGQPMAKRILTVPRLAGSRRIGAF